MTAEIAILNKTGIALAADSAATFGSNQSTFNTANKLFNLNKYHPIGILIYNNADFMGIPFETIIKAYRAYVKDKICDTIEEESKKFIHFLETNEDIFPKSFQEEYINFRIKNLFLEIKINIEKEIEKVTESKSLNEKGVLDIIEKIFFKERCKITTSIQRKRNC